MGTDQIKLTFTYLIALIVIVGGGAMLFAIRLDPPDSQAQNLSLVLAGFIGSAMTFVFGHETATRAARSTEAAITAGVVAATSPGPITPAPVGATVGEGEGGPGPVGDGA